MGRLKDAVHLIHKLKSKSAILEKTMPKKAAVATETPRYVVASSLHDAFSEGVRVSSELADALNVKVAAQLKEAEARAKANGRSTVRPEDL